MDELIKILLIYGMIMLFIKILSNKGQRKKHNRGRIQRKVFYEEKITKNGQTTNIKRTYTDGDLEQPIPEVEDILSEKIFDKKSLLEEQKQLEQINEFFEKTNTINNNNRHSYLYQDIEKEIIKVDHTFSKEVFLNNAKELFLKYHNAMVKENWDELFHELDIKVSSKIEIFEKGNLNGGLYHE